MSLWYEVHTRQWLRALSRRHRREIDLHAVPEDELDAISARGVTHLWTMGVWPTGKRSRERALFHASLRAAYVRALPDWTDDDVAGSPYAPSAHHVATDLGGDAGLAHLRARLAERGVKLILDFVPNHTGLDHAWLVQRPELYVHSQTAFPGSFVVDDGLHVANGRDPWFPPWDDTAQLDHRRAETREAMADVLASIAARCDGVRCDMAMLALPDVFLRTWPGAVDVDAARVDGDFWPVALQRARAVNPTFFAMAEAYWDLEPRLLSLGFDAAYDKQLLDHLVHDRGADAAAHVRDSKWMSRAAHFLENHDEERAATAIPMHRHRAAALTTLMLPGVRFLHDGQLEGRRLRSPIQLARRRDDDGDAEIAAMYAALIGALSSSSVGHGEGRVLAPFAAWEGNPSHAAFIVVQWERDLCVVNLAPHRGQCRVVVPLTGTWRLVDRLGDEQWVRDGAETSGAAGLFLDVDAYGAQVFALERL